MSETVVKKRVGSTFVFPPELGGLLRVLRRRSGMSADLRRIADRVKRLYAEMHRAFT